MHYHFKIHKEENGYWAECIELKGCKTEADSIEELNTNMQVVLDLFLSEPADSKMLFPEPENIKISKNIVQITVSPKVAFAYNLRKQRIIHNLTQKQVSEQLGLKNLYSYQRLESAKTSNPALSTLYKIKKVFPKFKVDDIIEVV